MLITAGSFVLSLLILGLLYAIYKLTGPHPGAILAMRRARFWARWLLPGV